MTQRKSAVLTRSSFPGADRGDCIGRVNFGKLMPAKRQDVHLVALVRDLALLKALKAWKLKPSHRQSGASDGRSTGFTLHTGYDA
jgi:hypothetical protein